MDHARSFYGCYLYGYIVVSWSRAIFDACHCMAINTGANIFF